MTDPTDLIARADAAMDGVTEGPWAAGTAQWPEQIGCCPLIGRPYSIHGTDFHNVSAATTLGNARFIAASRQLVPALRDALAAALTRAQALQAERDSLAGALQPFADAADELDELGMDNPHQQAPVTYDDCATARAALTGEPQR